MLETTDSYGDLCRSLETDGYWPARAERLFSEGQYSAVVELCNDHLPSEPRLVSGRLICARALYLTGQLESAAEHFFQTLSLDPENLVALKYLGDIAYSKGEQTAALSYYHRMLEIDPYCQGIHSELRSQTQGSMQTITLLRGEEIDTEGSTTGVEIPFYTETMGDLYLNQGYPRLAAKVYRSLAQKSHHPRLAGKLTQAEQAIKDRQKRSIEHGHHAH